MIRSKDLKIKKEKKMEDKGPILVTGVAGFIGYHVAKALLNQGFSVVGIDNLDPYYDVALKQARLDQIQSFSTFTFHFLDIRDRPALEAFVSKQSFSHVIHLAAQAGVRHSLTHPYAYGDTNLLGHLNMLEACRAWKVQHFVYASSSSVYGASKDFPFKIQDPANTPLSLYAATKRSQEMMSYAYSHLFSIPSSGLRFFTVYGPWGRPDMSAFLFLRSLLADQEFPVFNYGNMRRNFTYIDDIVQGILGCLGRSFAEGVFHNLYNLGQNHSESLLDFIAALEHLTGKQARMRLEPLQPGDVPETLADLSESQADFGFSPKIALKEGLSHFVAWYRTMYPQEF
jgi:UDP-glucuronate 4-epimerase